MKNVLINKYKCIARLRLLCTVITLLVMAKMGYAQARITIYTPKCTPLEVSTTNYLSYNCHAYAWHMRDGNATRYVHIEPDQVRSTYLNDGSYSYVGEGRFTNGVFDYTDIPWKANLRVMDSGGNHSAVTKKETGIVDSKWGTGGELKIGHTIEECPFWGEGTVLYFYEKNGSSLPCNGYTGPEMQILGPDYFCSSGVYTIENLPSNATVSWSANGGLSPLTGTGSSFTVSRTRISSATITATVTTNNVSKTLTKTVQVGAAVSHLELFGDEEAYVRDPAHVVVENLYDTEGHIQEYVWSVSGGSISGQGRPDVRVRFNSPGYYMVSATGIPISGSNCGHTPSGTWSINVRSMDMTGEQLYSVAYPNPASRSFTIEKKQNAAALEKNAKQSGTIVQLYNQSKQLVHEQLFNGEQLSLDVSSLPNGTYFLNVVENGKLVEQQTVIVKH